MQYCSGQHPIFCLNLFLTFSFPRNQRRGDIEEHAVLLCSLLLGFGLESYVCLGSKREVVGTWRKRRSNVLLNVDIDCSAKICRVHGGRQ